MTFQDEDLRLQFHKANTVMQALVQAFESMCFEHGEQVHVIDLKSDVCAILGVELQLEPMMHIYFEFNKMYGRKGLRDETLTILDKESGLFQIYADSGKSLRNLN